jgi:hypothetical protein
MHKRQEGASGLTDTINNCNHCLILCILNNYKRKRTTNGLVIQYYFQYIGKHIQKIYNQSNYF